MLVFYLVISAIIGALWAGVGWLAGLSPGWITTIYIGTAVLSFLVMLFMAGASRAYQALEEVEDVARSIGGGE